MNFREFLSLAEQAEIEFSQLGGGVYHVNYTDTISLAIHDDMDEEPDRGRNPVTQEDIPPSLLKKATEDILKDLEAQEAPAYKYLQKAAVHSNMLRSTMTVDHKMTRSHFTTPKFVEGTVEYGGIGKRIYILIFEISKLPHQEYAQKAFQNWKDNHAANDPFQYDN